MNLLCDLEHSMLETLLLMLDYLLYELIMWLGTIVWTLLDYSCMNFVVDDANTLYIVLYVYLDDYWYL